MTEPINFKAAYEQMVGENEKLRERITGLSKTRWEPLKEWCAYVFESQWLPIALLSLLCVLILFDYSMLVLRELRALRGKDE